MRSGARVPTIRPMGVYWSVGLSVLVLGCVYFAARLLRSAQEAERERHHAQAASWRDNADSRESSAESTAEAEPTAPAILSPPEDRGFGDARRHRGP